MTTLPLQIAAVSRPMRAAACVPRQRRDALTLDGEITILQHDAF
eukprot:CAMPEP_0174834838 /NCGR_PEP_ID=MMETSP1114-20130205/5076_1 /TAXON_ID=312471 /ORGANISM="Neobodo designis, Strain CCAP 1951/1" /LENGTH=43 /DNA_ID= /DNA_START= /DNA_END= /DNA_ORIENTATION=